MFMIAKVASGTTNLFSHGYSLSLYYAACYEMTACHLTNDQFLSILADQFKVPKLTFAEGSPNSEIFEQKILTNILQREKRLCSSIDKNTDVSQSASCAFSDISDANVFIVIYDKLSIEQLNEIVKAYNKHYQCEMAATSFSSRHVPMHIKFNKCQFFSKVMPDLIDVTLSQTLGIRNNETHSACV